MTSPNHEVEPASDYRLSVYEDDMNGEDDARQYDLSCGSLRALIARIRAEQARATLKHEALGSVMNCMEWDSMDGDTQTKVWEVHNERPHP